MAKPVIKFDTVAYEIGGHAGYRPQLLPQDGKFDLDFCREVVSEKRLAMSPEELLHAMEMVGEVGPAKVAEDGRPRGVTKLLKWNRFGKGKLESPTSPWNDSCRAVIRAQLLADAEKTLDATFVNVNSGIRVRLDNVTWIGAKDVQNVIKIGEDIGANGSNMQFVEAFGDTATLTKREKSGADTVVRLTNKSSDVSRGVFGYPPEFSDVEAGTQLTFTQKSRGGVEGGQVFTVKKVVTVIAADVPPAPPAKPTVTSVTATDGLPFEVGKDFAIRGTGLAEGEIRVGFHNAGVEYEERVLDGYVKSRTDTEIVIDGPESYADMEASCDGFKLMIAGEEVYNF